MRPRILALACACALVAAPSPAVAAGRGDVAALQAALRAGGLYSSDIDGVLGPGTRAAVARLQRRRGLAADGVAGPRTLRALGGRGRPPYGSRPLAPGRHGWDVAALQFRLQAHGFPSGGIDGGYGARTARAVARFQGWAGLAADGVAGPATFRALRTTLPPRCPIALQSPVRALVTDRFGPRGTRLHAGLDFPAAYGARVVAAAAGRVSFAGFDPGGWGNFLIVNHGNGVLTRYAHLSRFAASRGQAVAAGALIGRVGATGLATGPHLHFEVMVRGAVVDPLPVLR